MSNVEELVVQRIAAKRAEDEAVKARRAIDEQIATLLKTDKAEGTVSERAGDFKVSVTYGITRNVDNDKLRSEWDKLTPAAQAAFRWKAEAAVGELKKLEGVDALMAASYITSKPASPQVKIEAV